jgi:hypothetical protein
MAPCKYAEIGCAVEVPRKHLKHEEDQQHHLEFAIDAILELHATLRSLDSVEIPNLEGQMFEHHMTLGTLQDELSRINDSVAEQKALLELKETVKKQGNMLAQLQSVTIAQSEKNNELKVKLESQDLETASSCVIYSSNSSTYRFYPVIPEYLQIIHFRI